MKSLLIALAIAGLSCLSFNANASNQPLQSPQTAKYELGGGIIEVIGTLTYVSITIVPNNPGDIILEIIDDNGRKIIAEELSLEGETTIAYSKSRFTKGTYKVYVRFSNGIAINGFVL